MIKKFFKRKFILFAIVAVASLVFELALYTFFFEVLKIDKLVSSPLAQVCSMVFNFTLNKFVTFRTNKQSLLRESIGYFIVWFINLTISTELMSIILSNTNIYPTVARFGVIVVMFFFNYTMLRLFVFRTQSVPAEEVIVV